MPVIEVGGFLRCISRGNERIYKATFPWMREKKDISLQPVVTGYPGCRED